MPPTRLLIMRFTWTLSFMVSGTIFAVSTIIFGSRHAGGHSVEVVLTLCSMRHALLPSPWQIASAAATTTTFLPPEESKEDLTPSLTQATGPGALLKSNLQKPHPRSHSAPFSGDARHQSSAVQKYSDIKQRPLSVQKNVVGTAPRRPDLPKDIFLQKRMGVAKSGSVSRACVLKENQVFSHKVIGSNLLPSGGRVDAIRILRLKRPSRRRPLWKKTKNSFG